MHLVPFACPLSARFSQMLSSINRERVLKIYFLDRGKSAAMSQLASDTAISGVRILHTFAWQCSRPHWMGFEQPGLVESVPARGKGVGTR